MAAVKGELLSNGDDIVAGSSLLLTAYDVAVADTHVQRSCHGGVQYLAATARKVPIKSILLNLLEMSLAELDLSLHRRAPQQAPRNDGLRAPGRLRRLGCPWRFRDRLAHSPVSQHKE